MTRSNLILVAKVIAGAMLFPCDNTTISETPSPDGSLAAVVFERSCGATTGFSTQVSIFRSWLPRWEGAGNVFVADTDRGRAPAGAHGGPEVAVRWETARRLVVSHHQGARVFSAQTEWGSVQVVYDMTPR